MNRDTLFQPGPDDTDAFRFDERVTRVFGDMIVRSVPGYGQSLAGIAGFARLLMPEDSVCYDLGCSLGAATLAVSQGLGERHATIIGIDNAPAMIAQCKRDSRLSTTSQTIRFMESDILDTPLEPCHLVILNYTFQFIPPHARETLLRTIYAALIPGGALILSEKFTFDDVSVQKLMTQMHEDHKRANAYSELEIAGKRAALENVLIADSRTIHQQRLQACGFSRVTLWHAQLTFGSFIAFRDPA
ncbi:MAG: carboxy-S-adenosyl-L-methionine synthase CmoA [Pseudomonadota bacterium]